jgi:hypothetical protein
MTTTQLTQVQKHSGEGTVTSLSSSRPSLARGCTSISQNFHIHSLTLSIYSFTRHTCAPTARPSCTPVPRTWGTTTDTGFCADSTKQVSKNKPPPPWTQLPGIFSEGKRFHSHAFLKTVKQIYEQVFLQPSGESPALKQEAFAMMLLDWPTTLKEGTMLFKLYEELEIDNSMPDALLTVHNGIKHLHIEYLQEHWDS